MPEQDPSSTLNHLTLLGQDTRAVRQFMDYFIQEVGGIPEFARIVAKAVKDPGLNQTQKFQIIRQLLVVFGQVDNGTNREDVSDLDPIDLEIAFKKLQQKAAG